MMKAIICDDDEIILKGLTSVVEWSRLGIEIVGTATDGRAGLALMREKRPDLLLSDIKMPFYDGLALAQEAQKLKEDVLIVMLSGYDDFSYAQKAVRLGVLDYLMKPIDLDELYRVLGDAVKRYKLAQKENRLQKESFLADLLHQQEEPTDWLGEFHVTDYCGVFIVQPDDTATAQLFAQEVFYTDIVERVRQKGIYVLSKNPFVLAEVAFTQTGVKARLDECICTFRQYLAEKWSGYSASTGTSDVADKLFHLNQCYQQAQEALQLKYIKGLNQDHFYAERQQYDQKQQNPTELFDIDFVTPIKCQDEAMLKSRLKKLSDLLTEQTGLDSYLYLNIVISNTYTNVIKELKSVGIPIGEIFDNPVEEYKKFANCVTVQMGLDALQENLLRIFQFVQTQKSSKYAATIHKALRYVTDCYQNPALSIEEVAQSAHMSVGHFSTIFKDETGHTFTDYLIRIRMEKAQDLILNSTYKMYEIASLVGYENANYFSAAFKKYTHLSPSEFKAEHQSPS